MITSANNQLLPKLLMVLGGGLWQVPTILKAKEMGLRVIVADIYQERPGYQYCDFHEVIDIRDKSRILEAAKKYKIDGIICDTTDVGVITAAYVAESLELPGIGLSVAENFTFKDRMREISLRAGVRNPNFKLVEDIEAAKKFANLIGYPLIVKPTDNQSSRGVTKVINPSNLNKAVSDAFDSTKQKKILIEEFIEGKEVTVEGFVLNGESRVLGISEKERSAIAPQISSRLTYPPEMSQNKLQELSEANHKVCQALGLQAGVTHAEYIMHTDGPFLVEIAARGGGSLIYSHIIPHLSGWDVQKTMIELAIGIPATFPKNCSTNKAANLEFFIFPPGKIKNITGLDQARSIKGVEELVLEFNTGETIAPVKDDRSRSGFMLVFGESREEVLQISNEVKNTVQVDFE